MDKTYKPQQIEQYWSQHWEENHLSKPSGKGSPYCIMLPPPNVTGTLHMGHGFQQTLMDALVRQQRMKQKNTLWQGGSDHAGIATQMVVERRLMRNGQTRHDLGRESFIQEVWKWRDHSGDIIHQQMRRLGVSIDWSSTRFTMDEVISRATLEAFVRLYREGLIYRGKRLVNWDPQLLTAISDLEVETVETDGFLWHIRYPISGRDDYLVVATTRPETMLGDTAVAVHPDDERYLHLIGQYIQLPLCDRSIPIIADAFVDREFGTGCVKVTPAHDFNDHEIGRRHDLPLVNILTPDARINENAPAAYQGLDRYEARNKIIADLEAQNLLEKTEAHRLSVPRGDRSGVIIEPYLTDQWFLKMKPLAEPAIAAVNNGDMRFVPEAWTKTYTQWLENIEDWCISRQLWWGHRIPVWYDSDNNIYVGLDENDVRERHKLAEHVELRQDHDVLDTWFSASLWPFATLGWPAKSDKFKIFYPSNVLITGFDIIFFWVARMVMMGIKFTGKVPFKEVYIHGLIRDSHGAKMSKSKGNVLDPIDLIDGISLDDLVMKRTANLLQPHMAKQIEKITRQTFPNGIPAHGTDALRFTFCALASPGRNINFDLGRIDGYRNFCNKIWNAARYVLMNTDGKSIDFEKALQFSLADQWIRSSLQRTIQRVNKFFEQYRFDLLANTLYEFIWNEYCDWYLELAKCDLNAHNAPAALSRGTRLTLLEVLETLLRLLHPIMPFITEEIWQRVAPLVDQSAKSIMLAKYPEYNSQEIDAAADTQISWLKSVVVAIRTIRAEMDVNPGRAIPIIFHKGSANDHKYIQSLKHYIKSLAKVSEISHAETKEALVATATAVVNQLEIHIPLAGLIDKKDETARLNREIEKLNKELQKSAAKLNNPNYISRAPQEIVVREQKRLAQTELSLRKLQEQIKNIEKL